MRITYSALLVLALCSCSFFYRGPGASQQLPEERLALHTVKYRGESLSAISAWYLKSAERWPEIASYNGHVDLLNLQLGDIIRLPVGLIERSEPMPQSYLRDLEKHNDEGFYDKLRLDGTKLSPNEEIIGSFLE